MSGYDTAGRLVMAGSTNCLYAAGDDAAWGQSIVVELPRSAELPGPESPVLERIKKVKYLEVFGPDLMAMGVVVELHHFGELGISDVLEIELARIKVGAASAEPAVSESWVGMSGGM